MMQNYDFNDIWAAYVAGSDTSARHVDVFYIRRRDFGDRATTATRDDHHVVEMDFLEHQTTVHRTTNRLWLRLAR